MNLTNQNRKTIEQEKRIAYVFSGMVMTFGGLFNIMYFILSKDINWLLVILINAGLFTLSFLISYLMNKQLNKDLKLNIKSIKIESVEKKEIETSYEAGSGTLNIPLLGNLFPKLWRQEMRASYKWWLIINGVRYEVNQKVFDNVNTGYPVEMHYTINSDILLEIKLPHEPSKYEFSSQIPVLSRIIW